MRYRPEIDGLRAVAVVPVILFHAKLGLVPGGFVGVDVFFVISGFLISSIILGDLQNKRFSILGFYERRLRRIAPAMLFVCLACLPFAALWMLPSEFKAFGRSLFHSVLMVANFDLWGDDYFSPSGELKPLLHMWSLAVEEQFYLLFPPLLWLLYKGTHRWMSAVVAALAAVSFVLTWPLSAIDPDANFYLPFSRLWELAGGALLAIHRPDTIRLAEPAKAVLAGLGLVAIVGSCLLLKPVPHHPGPVTLIPVIGALMVIAFASSHNLAGRLLSLKPVVWIGLISYSLYLWHQPVFAFARLRMIEPVSPGVYLALIVLTVALAVFSYLFVETPFRRGRLFAARRILGFAGGAGMALMIAGMVIASAQGFPVRAGGAEAGRVASMGLGRRCDGILTPACVTKPEPSMAVWGDSFAMHLFDGIASSERADAPGLAQLNKSSCGPLPDVVPALPNRPAEWPAECLDYNAGVRSYLNSNPSLRYVVLSSQFHTYLEGRPLIGRDGRLKEGDYETVRQDLEQNLDWLGSVGLKPVVFAPPPRNGRDAGLCVARRRMLGLDEAFCDPKRADERVFDAAIERLMGDISKRFPVVSLTDYLCDDDRCRVIDEGVSLYYDDGHFSPQGSRHLGRRLDLYDRLIDAAEHGCSTEPAATEPHGVCQLMPSAGTSSPALPKITSARDPG
jgi:peptidoglycan/LPS O-acetylase OafA/YrhL